MVMIKFMNFKMNFKISKRILLVLVTVVCILLFVINTRVIKKDIEIDVNYRCYMDAEALPPNAEGTVLKNISDPIPHLRENIFFIETSCRRTDFQYSAINLTSRQACAIESAALHHPNFTVYVLFASPTYLPKSRPILDALTSYKNVEFRQINVRKFAQNTPIEDWINNGTLFKSYFMIYHLSDLLRLIALYRFGGIYLDLDVVVLRSMANLTFNYVGAEKTAIGNSVISLEPKGFGHMVGAQFLRDFKQNFNGSLWTQNGPMLIWRVLGELCGTFNIEHMIESPQCHGFRVFKREAFFAIDWKDWNYFFNPKLLHETFAIIKDSYLIHAWNYISKNTSLKVDAKVAYIKLAQKNCPKVYAATVDYF